MGVYWCGHEVLEPLDEIPHDAIGREVRGIHNHVGVRNLPRLYDCHAVVSDVDDRDAVCDQSCEYRYAKKKVLNTKEARVAPRTSQFAAQPVVSPREQAAAKTPHPCSKCGVV